MPDRSPERSNPKSERKRLNSAVVVSKSFQKLDQRREHSRERRERGHRERSPDDEDKHKILQKMRMDHGVDSKEQRRLKLSERLGARRRRSNEDNDVDDSHASSGRERRPRNTRRVRGLSPDTNQQRQTVFDRLEQGPPRDRGFVRNMQGGGLRDQRMVEMELNPQDVPRGKRYFLHDDREMPRRQQSDRSRARSRSPLWVHDKFEILELEDQEQEDKVEVEESFAAQQQDNERVQEKRRDKERTLRVYHHKNTHTETSEN